MKKKHAFVQKAISAIAAFSLVVTMCPAEALAATPAQSDAETAAEETASADADADAVGVQPEITSEELPIVAAGASTSDASAAANPADAERAAADQASAQSTAEASSASTAAPSDIEMLTAQVPLASQASTLIAAGGLTYAINPDAPGTVSLVGISNQALKGTLEIPAEIYSGAATYSVTGICAGGGSLMIRPAI